MRLLPLNDYKGYRFHCLRMR